MIHNLPHSAQQDNGLADTGILRRLLASLWEACQSAGMARASGHLDQLAVRYTAIRPEFAQELRAASAFANRFTLR